MREQTFISKRLLALLLFFCVFLFASSVNTAAKASTIAPNTMTALINDETHYMSLTSFYQLMGYAPTFSRLDSNGFPLSAIMLYIPFDAKTGSVYYSGEDNAFSNAGIAYSDYIHATTYSSLACETGGDDYFGFAGGHAAWTIQIDGVSEDGSVIWGQFLATFDSTIWGTGESATVYDGVFCLDMKQLPETAYPSYEPSDPFSDSSLDALLGPIEIPGINAPSYSAENTLCRICNGTGYKRSCSLCDGLGYGTGADTLYKGAYVCASCLGEGGIICVTCGGDGWVAP